MSVFPLIDRSVDDEDIATVRATVPMSFDEVSAAVSSIIIKSNIFLMNY